MPFPFLIPLASWEVQLSGQPTGNNTNAASHYTFILIGKKHRSLTQLYETANIKIIPIFMNTVGNTVDLQI